MAKGRRKVWTVKQLLDKKFKTLDFTGRWLASIGVPERGGSAWIVYGNSGNGKTRFNLELVKCLLPFGRVAYNTIEEGAKLSFQKAVRETNFNAHRRRFTIWDRVGMDDMRELLRQQRSPNFIIIDSIQYTNLDKRSYKELQSEFRNKLFVFVSHADGKQPAGSLAKLVRYDADVKVRVEGYKAFITSRYGGGVPFIIWEEGARKYWGENNG